MMKTAVIIPARYESTRFPGKPLINILGQSLIQRVWVQCTKLFSSNDVYIATDDDRIERHCEENKMQCIMTSTTCLTGTDRVAQAYVNLNKKYDVIINVQGDEPLIEPIDILQVLEEYKRSFDLVCCGMCKIKTEDDFRNPNIIKIVCGYQNHLLYASRSAIPTNKNLEFKGGYKQVCIYAFSPSTIIAFHNEFKKSTLELIEDIEILRFLEIGYDVKMIEVSDASISVDVPEDVEKVKLKLEEIDDRQLYRSSKGRSILYNRD